VESLGEEPETGKIQGNGIPFTGVTRGTSWTQTEGWSASEIQFKLDTAQRSQLVPTQYIGQKRNTSTLRNGKGGKLENGGETSRAKTGEDNSCQDSHSWERGTRLQSTVGRENEGK